MKNSQSPIETVADKIKMGESCLLHCASLSPDPFTTPACLIHSLSCIIHYMKNKGLDVDAYLDAAFTCVASDSFDIELDRLSRITADRL